MVISLAGVSGKQYRLEPENEEPPCGSQTNVILGFGGPFPFTL